MKQKYLVAQSVSKEFRLIQSKQCFSWGKFVLIKTLFYLFLLECCSNSELPEQNIIYNPADGWV
jgi:hypothetical protein